jgi:hypothetical protein
MPEATLKFQLPEEEEEFKRAVKATDLALALLDMQDYLRNQLKHEVEEGPYINLVSRCLENTRARLNTIMHERSIDLEDILT